MKSEHFMMFMIFLKQYSFTLRECHSTIFVKQKFKRQQNAKTINITVHKNSQNSVWQAAQTRSSSTFHETTMLFTTEADKSHNCVMLTGRPGRFGSAPGLFVGITFCHHTFNSHNFTRQLLSTLASVTSVFSIHLSTRNCTKVDE